MLADKFLGVFCYTAGSASFPKRSCHSWLSWPSPCNRAWLARIRRYGIERRVYKHTHTHTHTHTYTHTHTHTRVNILTHTHTHTHIHTHGYTDTRIRRYNKAEHWQVCWSYPLNPPANPFSTQGRLSACQTYD